MDLENAAAIGWRTNNAGQRFGLGHTNGGFFIFRTASDPGTNTSTAIYDFAINNTGNIGIGNASPRAKLDVQGSGVIESSIRSSNDRAILSLDGRGNNQRGIFSLESAGGFFGIFDRTAEPQTRLAIAPNGNVGIGGSFPLSSGKLTVLGGILSTAFVQAPTLRALEVFTTNIEVNSTASTNSLRIRSLGAGGNTQLCRNSGNSLVAFCSSSLRYKTNLQPFPEGLNLIKKLRPISFNWKSGGAPDVGFGAEDVANVNPLFVTYNDTGDVEGVKYDRLSVVFVNAIKEQQAQIERQQKQIDELKKLVCRSYPTAEACKE
jgi:hypothetical protein